MNKIIGIVAEMIMKIVFTIGVMMVETVLIRVALTLVSEGSIEKAIALGGFAFCALLTYFGLLFIND